MHATSDFFYAGPPYQAGRNHPATPETSGALGQTVMRPYGRLMAEAAATTAATAPADAMDAARAEIDVIDHKILSILADRVRCNEIIAAAKAASGVTMPLRPAREVKMLRKLIGAAPPGVDADLVFDVWRAMIAANVRRQRPVEVVVAGSGGDMMRMFDTARRHFSGAARIARADEPRDALNRVTEQPATVAVLPWPGPAGLATWWAMFTERRYANISIIAALPMRADGEPEAALVANGATLEPAGEDHTFALAFDPHYRVSRAINEAGLRGREMLRVRETVMIEFEGFLAKSDPRLVQLSREGLEGVRVIGSYARV
jgi:chorismate mutase